MDGFGEDFGGRGLSSARKQMASAVGVGFDPADVERIIDTTANDTDKASPSTTDWRVSERSDATESPRFDVDYSTPDRLTTRPAQRHSVNIGGRGEASERTTTLDTPRVIIPAGGIAVLEDGSAAAIIYRVNPIPANIATASLPASPVAVPVAVIFAGDPGSFPVDGISDMAAMNTLLATAREVGFSGSDPFLALSALVENGLAIPGESDPVSALEGAFGEPFGDGGRDGGRWREGFGGGDDGGDGGESESGMQTGPIVAALALGAAWLLSRGG